MDSDSIALQALRTDLAAEIAATDGDVTTINNNISTINNNITTINNNITQTNSDVTAVENSVTALAADLDSESAVLGRTWKQATAPGNPGVYDLWYDTDSGILFSYDSTDDVWVQTI